MAPAVRSQEDGLSRITEVGQMTDRIDGVGRGFCSGANLGSRGRAALAQYSSASITVSTRSVTLGSLASGE